jgi:conjugal transfer mating pair stabilization protein TraN
VCLAGIPLTGQAVSSGKTCWQYAYQYSCSDGPDTSDCDGYNADPTCTKKSSECENNFNGNCIVEVNTYSCQSAAPQTETVMDCSGRLFCLGENCFDTGYENDTDFAKSMALMEAAREGAVYGDPNSIFSGEDDSCRIRLFGLGNCCKSSGGAQNNNVLFDMAISAGSQAVTYGSKYVYDSIYPTLAQGIQALGESLAISALSDFGKDAVTGAAGGALGAGFTPSIGAFGFSVSYVGAGQAAANAAFAAGLESQAVVDAALATGMDAAAAEVALGNAALAEGGSSTLLGTAGGFEFLFNPYALAFAVVMIVYQVMTSCNNDEMMFAMRKGQNLCHYVGTYCSSDSIFGCVEDTQTYCCYNSRLARIVNEEGRAQIGKDWGDKKNPNCSGFTTEEFESLDFGAMDLSEFTDEIMRSVSLPNVDGLSQDMQQRVIDKTKNYYDQGKQ